MKRLPHNPALDGIRAFGMTAVMIGHLGFLPGAYVFIDSFFVLSGFLISTLLLAEHEKRGTISIKQFYARRAVRLFPAYFVYLVAGIVMVAALKKGDSVTGVTFVGNTITSLLYVNNYYHVWHHDAGLWFDHIWTLSIEEQFYLLWPPFFLWLASKPARRERLLPTLLCVAGGFALVRTALVLLGASSEYVYLSMEARADQLLLGCAMAVWRFDGYQDAWTRGSAGRDAADLRSRAQVRASTPGKLVDIFTKVGFFCFATLLVLCFLVPPLGTQGTWYGIFGYPSVSLIGGVMIISLAQGQSLFNKLLGWAPLAAMGRISYGFYIWHYPVAALGHKLIPRVGTVPGVIAVWLVSLTLALLSWNLIEQPIQRWWQRSSRDKRQQSAPELKPS